MILSIINGLIRAIAVIALLRIGASIDKAIPVIQEFIEMRETVEGMKRDFYQAAMIVDRKLKDMEECGDCGKKKNPPAVVRRRRH